MGTRLELQTLLENILGSRNVYYQPPETIKLSYPCIIYKLYDRKTKYADNQSYNNTKRYSITVIDRNPDGIISETIAVLPMCTFDRRFFKDGLNNDIYNLYF